MHTPVQFNGGPDYTMESSYDLVGAVQRQSAFFYNVSLPHYKDSGFLQSAISRYKVSLRSNCLIISNFTIISEHNNGKLKKGQYNSTSSPSVLEVHSLLAINYRSTPMQLCMKRRGRLCSLGKPTIIICTVPVCNYA